MPLITDRASSEKTIKDIIHLMKQGNWDLAFDKFDLLDPSIYQQHLDLLIDNFNPSFFNTHSAAFVKAIAEKLKRNPNGNLLEKPWFGKLVLIPEVVKEFNAQKKENLGNSQFLQIADAFNCILDAKVTSHFFNIFSRTCKFHGFEFNLEYSYHQTFEPIFAGFHHEFLLSKKKLPEQHTAIPKKVTPINALTVLTSFTSALPPHYGEHQALQKSFGSLQKTLLNQKIENEEFALAHKISMLQSSALLAKYQLPLDTNTEDLQNKRKKIEQDTLEQTEILRAESKLIIEKLRSEFAKSQQNEVEPTPLEVTTDVHFSALTLYQSQAYGTLMALGNVGAGSEYTGIQIYKLKKELDPIITIHIAEDKSLPHDKYLELLESSKGELLVEIPILEQLGGYCGLRSAAELNEFSCLFFQILEDTDPKKLDLDQILEQTHHLHLEFINFSREKIGGQLLKKLTSIGKGIELRLSDEFFQDLLAQSKRYNLSEKFIKSMIEFMEECDIPVVFPQACYQNYLLNERYHLTSNPITGVVQQHYQDIIDQQCNRLIVLFHKLSSDYDSDQLDQLEDLDFKINNCILYGYEQATAIAYAELAPDPIDYYLSGQYCSTNPLQVSYSNTVLQESKAREFNEFEINRALHIASKQPRMKLPFSTK